MSALDRAYEESAAFLGRIWRENRDVPVEDHVTAILESVRPGLAARLPSGTLGELVQAYSEPALLVPPALDNSAPAALQTLGARGYTLCLVSNTMRTPGATLRKILEHYHVLGCFSRLTFSDECGIRKPDPEIFRLTLRAIGVAPDEAVHVGDDPILDVQGARRAGMRVIQVATDRRDQALAPPPDALIPRLSGLPDAVAELEER